MKKVYRGAAKRRRGFTLMELLVVVIVIGILAAVSMPMYFKQTEQVRATEMLNYIKDIRNGVEVHYARNGAIPPNLSSLSLDFKGTLTNNNTIELKNGMFIQGGVASNRFSASAVRAYGAGWYGFAFTTAAADTAIPQIVCVALGEESQEMCLSFNGTETSRFPLFGLDSSTYTFYAIGE